MAAASPNGKRVCLLTGASGTLGTEFCRSLRKSYDIAAVCSTRLPSAPSQYSFPMDPLNPTRVSGVTDPVFAVRADLFDDRDIQRVVELTLARFGRIDLLINAAVYSRWASAVSTNELVDSAPLQFQMNVLVPLKMAVAVAREFWRDRGAENSAANRNIVNVSSTSGVYVYPNADQIVYSASKAALNYLTCHLASEFRTFGVRVNAVAPNAFPAIVPTRRVAQGIQRLDRGALTGQILIMDADGDLLYSPS
jgi:NAD(P)-dependent dehydrogenase (short-subunit alcohol dehydrogenase family)